MAPEIEPIQPSKPKRKSFEPNPNFKPNLPVSRANPLIDLDRAINLRLKGLTYAEIAAVFGVTKSAVQFRLHGYISDNIDIGAFSKHEADIIAGKRSEIVKSLTPTELKSATPYQRVGMYGILFDKERLLRGQSTANIAYKDMSTTREQAKAEMLRLAAELGEDVSDLDMIGEPDAV